MSTSDPGYIAAVEEQILGAEEGGSPIGSSIVDISGNIIGRGRNLKKQTGSVIHHGETAAFEAAGKKYPVSAFEGATLYTTLSPCPMCTGAAIFFKVGKVVIAENKHMSGNEDYLRSKGIEVVVLDDKSCEERMAKYVARNQTSW